MNTSLKYFYIISSAKLLFPSNFSKEVKIIAVGTPGKRERTSKSYRL